jgi:hypothetical protein
VAQAKKHSTTPLSALFTDPFLRTAFARAEQDGTAPLAVTVDRPRILTGGAAVRVRELVEACFQPRIYSGVRFLNEHAGARSTVWTIQNSGITRPGRRNRSSPASR